MKLGDPRPRPNPLRKFSKVEVPEIEPGTSWLVIRRANLSFNETLYSYIHNVNTYIHILSITTRLITKVSFETTKL